MVWGCKQQKKNGYFCDKSNLFKGYWVADKNNCRHINQDSKTCRNQENLDSRKCICGLYTLEIQSFSHGRDSGCRHLPLALTTTPSQILSAAANVNHALTVLTSVPQESKLWVRPSDCLSHPKCLHPHSSSQPNLPSRGQEGSSLFFSKMSTRFHSGRVK